MKKTMLLLVFSAVFTLGFSQDFSKLSEIQLVKVEDYKPAENQALECANYLFNNPVTSDELTRLSATQFIIKWMTGTPDYSFAIGEEATTLTKGSSDLFTLYMALMTKVVLDNSETKFTDAQIHSQVEAYLVEYCSNSKNKLKPSKALKKLIKAQKKKA